MIIAALVITHGLKNVSRNKGARLLQPPSNVDKTVVYKEIQIIMYVRLKRLGLLLFIS